MRVYFTFLLLLIYTGTISAQGSYMVFGKVFDESHNPIEFASVVLLDKATNKQVEGTTTKADGSFYFIKAKGGRYTMEVSIVGYEKYSCDFTVENNTKFNDIILKEDITTLKEAKVVANMVDYNMNGYEYKLGNVTALKGKDLTDVLKTAPGIMVHDDVTLYGRRVSNIYIDKRRVKMSDEELVTYLRSFRGEDLDKIEVISNPDVSERYGGISIKITTKKYSGGFVSASESTVGSKNHISTTPSANLNYRKDKFLLYTNLTYTTVRSKIKQTIENYWEERDSTVINYTTDETRLPLSIYGIFGIGYDVSKNDYFSAEVSYRNLNRKNYRNTSVEYTNTGILLDESYRNFKMESKSPTVSLMYTHKFKDASELKITGDYVGVYKKDDIANTFFQDERGGETWDITHTENNTSTFVGYANFHKKIKKKHQFNAGMRYSYINNEAVNNESSFEYTENEIIPFSSYTFNLKKFGFNIGAQAKWADIDGNSYLDFVPNVSANYYINPKRGHVLGLFYSCGVKRPMISQLNPNYYISQNDIYVRIGNPNLSSYRVNSYGMSLLLFNSIYLLAGYDSSNDGISSYMYSDEEGTIYQTYTNDSKDRSVVASLNFNKMLFNMMAVDLSTYYTFSNSTVREKTDYFNYISCSLQLSVDLPKSFSISMRASWNSSSKISFNATTKKPVSLKIDASKRFKRWKFGVGVFDVLDSAKSGKVIIDMNTYTKTIKSNMSGRRYALRISYNFNWGKSKGVRKADTQKSDINNRIGSDL